MKYKILIICLSFLFISQFTKAQDTVESNFAIVKVSEKQKGLLGSKLAIEIYYPDGRVVDGTKLVKNFEKEKFLENFSSTAYILGYMEENGYELVSTTAVGTDDAWFIITQYIFKRNKRNGS